MCLLPAGPGSLAARPAKQAGKCVYKLFKLWINFSGVCVCVSPHVVIFQKSGLLEIFSLKLERNLNSLRAGGSRGGLRGVPCARKGRAAPRPRSGRKRRVAVPGLVSDRASLSVKGHQPGPGAPRPLPVPSSGHRSTAGTRIIFPGSPGGEGVPAPPEGARGDAEPRRREAEEGCPGRGWLRSNEDSSATGGVLFLPRWSGEKGPRKQLGLRGRPSPPPRLLHGPAEAAGPDRSGGRAPGLEGPPSPGALRDGGSSPSPHLRLLSGSPQLCLSGCSRGRTADPSPALWHRLPPSTHGLFPPRLDSPSSGRCEQPRRPPQGPGGLLWPWHRCRARGARRLTLGTRKALSPGAPLAAGAPRRGGALPGARWSREEGKAEARLLVRIVIFHQSAAICVSAPDRTPAVLLAGVTETTQRWRRANCICSPAHRSKLRPSHGAGKGAKGPCDMREI